MSAIYPNPKTVKGQVLARFLQGRELTHKDVWLECFSSRLSHHAYSLKADGWVVNTIMRPVRTGDGRKEEIGYYAIPHDVIELEGERGQRFIEEAARATKQNGQINPILAAYLVMLAAGVLLLLNGWLA
jgi:hypothetical protein